VIGIVDQRGSLENATAQFHYNIGFLNSICLVGMKLKVLLMLS